MLKRFCLLIICVATLFVAPAPDLFQLKCRNFGV